MSYVTYLEQFLYKEINIYYIYVAWFITILSALLDIFSTYIGIRIGLIENNPVGYMLIEHIGVIIGLLPMKITVIIFSFIISYIFLKNRSRAQLIAPIILSIVWFAASFNNFYLIVLFY